VSNEEFEDTLDDQKQIPSFARNDASTSVSTGFLGLGKRCRSFAERAGDGAAVGGFREGTQNWLMYSGDYTGRRFSALEQINTSNAAKLVPAWVYQTMAGGKFETTPLVVDGILYGTGQDNRAFALDAWSGRPIWQYQRALPADIRPCCGA